MKRQNVLKRTLAIFLALVMLMSFAACSGNKEEEETTTEATETTETTEPTTAAPVYDKKINRLTGISDLSKKAYGKRPVAIMINNIKAALPQYGIADADIMFEVVVEGGITRMMAVYGDYTKVPNVCSVRSCRYYYPILAYGLDAVYICFGSNTTLGTPTLERLGIDYFDGAANYVTNLFGRDAQRLKTYSSEHTAYVKGENIPYVLEKSDIRTDYKEGKDVPVFNFREASAAAGDMESSEVKLTFSNSYYSTFSYSSEDKVYYKQHSGSAHKDSATGEQLNYVNVFALETEVKTYKKGPLMKVALEGGSGYYFSMGKGQKITWQKKTEGDTIEVFDADGNPLEVNPGNSYIGILSPDSIKINGESPVTTTAAAEISAAE